MAINKAKVVAGGVAAGLVMAVADIAVSKFVLGTRMIAEVNAFQAGMGDKMTAGNGWWVGPVMNGILCGILLIWLYAAIRPRFGPGQTTAIYAAVYFWITASVFMLSYPMMGMMSWGLWCMYLVAWLVITVIAAIVGARIYTEDGATP